MTTVRVESLPATWDDARDLPFFRTTDGLFPPDFCFGASVLLASYDDDTVDTVATSATTEQRTSWATTADLDGHTQPERGLTPVRIRRPG